VREKTINFNPLKKILMKVALIVLAFFAVGSVSAQSSKIEVNNFETKKRANLANAQIEDLIQASSSCPGGVDIQFTDLKYSGGCAGVLERTYTLRDQCNNEVTKVQYITIIDETPPVFTYVPADIQLADKTELGAPLSLIAEDDSNESVTVDVSDSYDTNDPAFVKVLRTWTATDVCGNQVSHTQTISISTSRGN
jgi:hypothetical protein